MIIKYAITKMMGKKGELNLRTTHNAQYHLLTYARPVLQQQVTALPNSSQLIYMPPGRMFQVWDVPVASSGQLS